jgi:hypothetical protein
MTNEEKIKGACLMLIQLNKWKAIEKKEIDRFYKEILENYKIVKGILEDLKKVN